MLRTSHDANLVRELGEYWDERAQSYSNGVVGELGDARKDAWKTALAEASGTLVEMAKSHRGQPRACDLGCGPGFFAILLAELGFAVDAVDASENMIERARGNFARSIPEGDAAFHVRDLLTLPFADDVFDLCVSRNVTWLMRDPERAYAEWLRVLKPGGKLVVYDANWYRYLVDPAIAAKRAADQDANELEGWDEDAQATSDEERRCEELARSLPLTYALRPKWDLGALASLGVSYCRADEDAWLRIWSENEQLYYGATPMFVIEAVK